MKIETANEHRTACEHREAAVRAPKRHTLCALLAATLLCASGLFASGCGGDFGGPGSASADAAGDATQAEAPEGDPAMAGPFGFGTPVTPEEIAAWDIDVGPDGEGLPPGSGTVAEGAVVYQESCARCHGASGIEGPNNVLVAQPTDSFAFGRHRELTTAIGNYWPYATTVFDYVRRAMPLEAPGSLTDSQVYAVTAWLLWRNGLVEEDAVMDAGSLPQVTMPARDHFVPSEDVRLDSLP